MDADVDIRRLRPWMELRFDRSAGPGGQNVNKVATRVTLLLDFERCAGLSAAQRERIRQRLSSRLAQDGRLRIVSQRARTQLGNRRAAEARLVELVTAALRVPKTRRPTKPTAASRARRVAFKRRRGEIKQLRRGQE